MSHANPTSLSDILLAIQRLTPGQRRQLQRRLHASGLMEPDELLTDQNRLAVAPALGMRRDAATFVSPDPVPPDLVPADPQPPARPVTPSSAGSDARSSGPVDDAEPDMYRSAVSGKIVKGPPQDAADSDPHAMPPVPGQAPEQPIVVIFDGGSKGNPGEGYGSYALRWPGRSQQIVSLQFGNRVTNNEAEYDTLIAALEAVRARLADLGAQPGTARLRVYGDSLLVINQVKGDWKCNEARLQRRRDRVRDLLQDFARWQLIHQDRSKSVEVLGH